jgi:rRNA-processing protein FCF1
MIAVILDTNFVIYCAEKKLDYMAQISSLMNEGYEVVVPKQVISELEDLKQNAEKYSDRTAVNLAMQILKFNKVKVVEARGRTADDAIANLSRFNIVATLDEGLKKRVGRIIIISRDRKLMFD